MTVVDFHTRFRPFSRLRPLKDDNDKDDLARLKKALLAAEFQRGTLAEKAATADEKLAHWNLKNLLAQAIGLASGLMKDRENV